MVRLIQRARRDETGATIIFLTITLVVMLGMAALVVDLGMGRSKRRQIQGSADAAALGAAQDLPNVTNGDATAKSLAVDNLPTGSFNWTGCTDSTTLAKHNSSACISYDTSYSVVHVRVPTQNYTTLFGRILGQSKLSAGGYAEARVVRIGLAGILPFPLFSTFSTGEACLGDASGGHAVAPCDGGAHGNFNSLDIVQYGNSVMGTLPSCSPSGQDDRYTANITHGIDHALTVKGSNATIYDDCSYVPGPNTIDEITGNNSKPLDDGIRARLRLGGGLDAAVAVGSDQLDNTPLWKYFDDSGNVPLECKRATFQSLPATSWSNQTNVCITKYASGSYDALLDRSILASPRFGWIPKFAQSSWPPGNSGQLTITAFVPVYLNRMMGGCTGAGSCRLDFTPGAYNAATATSNRVEMLTGFVLNNGMLKGKLSDPYAVGQTVNVELSK